MVRTKNMIKIDLFIYNLGGEIIFGWALIKLIREFIDYFNAQMTFKLQMNYKYELKSKGYFAKLAESMATDIRSLALGNAQNNIKLIRILPPKCKIIS